MPTTNAETLELAAHGSPKTARESASPNVMRKFALERTIRDMRQAAYQTHLKTKEEIRADREGHLLAARRATNSRVEAEALAAAGECTKRLLTEDKRFAEDNVMPHSNEEVCEELFSKAGYQKLREFGIADHVAAGEHELVKATGGMSPVDAVETLLVVCKECDAETKRVEYAGLPERDRINAAMAGLGYGEAEFVDALKKLRRPDIDSRGNFSMPVFEPPTIRLASAGGHVVSIDDGFSLASWIMHDKIKAEVTAILKREDYTGAIALKDRKPMVEAIAARRLFAERLAEHYFREGYKAGMPVRRFSRSAEAALDVHPLTKR